MSERDLPSREQLLCGRYRWRIVYARSQWRAMDGQLEEIRKQYPEIQKSRQCRQECR